jgi:hypothetical protein
MAPVLPKKKSDATPTEGLPGHDGASGETSVGIDVSQDQNAEKRPGADVEVLPPETTSRALTQIDTTRQELDAATTFPEVKAIQDKAAGVANSPSGRRILNS